MATHEKGSTNEHDSTHHHYKESPDAPVAFITSPMDTWDEKSQSFSPRHEASTLELFFDLFFVANLATFTAYHAVTNRDTFWSYVAFFLIIWATWFHVACFDARFASDHVWERICKVVHFTNFAGFALVGYKFVLFTDTTPRWVYRLLCCILLISRFWLGLQYLVTTVLCSTQKVRHLRLTLPLALNTTVFMLAAAIYGSLVTGFQDGKNSLTGVITALYVLFFVELAGPLTISCVWRRVSFKATHIGERLGLLGLIIIGEGVIGTTKTITRTMGKNGVYFEGCAQIFCIILILVFIWILYFDNLPKYQFGTIKQQFWMILHLPLHLAILGVAEGSQHIALARYTVYSATKLGTYVYYGCVVNHLDGPKLAANLTKAIDSFKLGDSDKGQLALPLVYEQVYFLGNQSGVCSASNTSDIHNGMKGIPLSLTVFFERAIGAMFQSLDMDIPTEGAVWGVQIATRSWKVVYTYYWSALLLLLICLTISALLADRGIRLARFRVTSLIARAIVTTFYVFALIHGLMNEAFYEKYLRSAWILPTAVLCLELVCIGDRISKWSRQRKEKKDVEYAQVSPSDASDEEGLRFTATGDTAYHHQA
ncbi:bacterial low temperature requirement A protein-domain-containing protein [Lophiotrema nucula]|uniref:Bacterial low temperature requirement A protein-domain-containing protein n=1 Tax=Lophiotrema nucula TaxID=690887 RepID=A0A6A5ZQL9_9PLEO|nr:bacterial low temperature requirement A protein-domain-containing protein [Lophiotrema nucula]